jgi:hypothetical protein
LRKVTKIEKCGNGGKWWENRIHHPSPESLSVKNLPKILSAKILSA